MKNSIRLKLENLKDRFNELEALLSDADVISDQNQFRELSKEYAELEEVVKPLTAFRKSVRIWSRPGKWSPTMIRTFALWRG